MIIIQKNAPLNYILLVNGQRVINNAFIKGFINFPNPYSLSMPAAVAMACGFNLGTKTPAFINMPYDAYDPNNPVTIATGNAIIVPNWAAYSRGILHTQTTFQTNIPGQQPFPQNY